MDKRWVFVVALLALVALLVTGCDSDEGTSQVLDTFTQSTLPELLEEDRIQWVDDLLPGQCAYTPYWAMEADYDGKLWINRTSRISGNKSLHRIYIKRVEEGVVVFEDTIPKDVKYEIGDHGLSEDFYLPVHLPIEPLR